MNSPVISAPSVNAPTIASSAVFIDLSISSWTGRKQDKRASTSITDQANAARGVASVSKKLLGDCAELDAVSKFAANARNIHYGMTMPWSELVVVMIIIPLILYVQLPATMTVETLGKMSNAMRPLTFFNDMFDP